MKRTTSREMAAPIAERLGANEEDVLAVLKALDDEIISRVVAGEIVEITGLGTFRIQVKKTTVKTIPGLGRVKIPEHYTCDFNGSKALGRAFAGIPPTPPEPIDTDPVDPDVLPGPGETEGIAVDNTGVEPVLRKPLIDKSVFRGKLAQFSDVKKPENLKGKAKA